MMMMTMMVMVKVKMMVRRMLIICSPSDRVFLPWEFINQTRGLFGNWSFDTLDEFTLPNGDCVNDDCHVELMIW